MAVAALGLAGCAHAGIGLGGPSAAALSPSITPGSTGSTESGSSPASASASMSSPASSSMVGSASASASESTSALPQLPRGGRSLFPRYRLVGYCGAPGSSALGQLGIGDPSVEADAIVRRAAAYAGNRTPMPVLELIASIVQGSPGADGMYRTRTSDTVIQRYLDVARAHKALLLLDIQPGRSPFIDEVKAYRKWLRQPDVGVALDPEWSLGPGQVPMRQFGRTTGRDIDQVAAYLSGLVRVGNLPQKALVYHQLTPYIVSDPTAIRPHPGVAVVQSVDGIGAPADKRQTWRSVLKTRPSHVYGGFKLFFHEDVQRSGVLMTPAQVLRLRPTPDYVMYE